MKSAEQEDIRVGLFKTKRIHLLTRGREQDEGHSLDKIPKIIIACVSKSVLGLENNIVCATVGVWRITDFDTKENRGHRVPPTPPPFLEAREGR